MQTAKWMLMFVLGAVFSVLPSTAARAEQGDGLTLSADGLWPRWQTRGVMGNLPSWRADAIGFDRPAGEQSRMSLMGDYYFSRSVDAKGGSASGFRTTSGVIVGPRSAWALPVTRQQPGLRFSADRRVFGNSASAWPDSDTATLPYLGIGYSGLSLRGGWSVSADLGLVALAPGQAVKLGRVFNGSQALDDMVRDMRISPVLQLGVSYSF